MKGRQSQVTMWGRADPAWRPWSTLFFVRKSDANACHNLGHSVQRCYQAFGGDELECATHKVRLAALLHSHRQALPPTSESITEQKPLRYHGRTEAPQGLTSGLVPNDAGHLDTLHMSIAKVASFTEIRWSNLTTPDPDLRARPS